MKIGILIDMDNMPDEAGARPKWLKLLHWFGYLTTAIVIAEVALFAGMIIEEKAAAQRQDCASISDERAIAMAREQKREMLGRSRRFEQEDFASDKVEGVVRDGMGGARVVFRGNSHRTLEARIDSDCYMGWSGTG